MGLRENLRKDTVKALHVHTPVEIAPDEVVGDAVAIMRQEGVGCVVVTEGGKPVGMFTERDMLRRVLAHNRSMSTPLKKVFTPNPEVIQESSSVAEVIRRMHQGGFRHMPVVDASRRLTGLASIKRIVKYLVEHFPSAVFNLPPDPAQKQLAREGA